MSTYYKGKQAASYDRAWKRFSERTHLVTCSMLDFKLLQKPAGETGSPRRILDVACGTGLLLHDLSVCLPHAELYGVDESQEMLAQARLCLSDHAHVHFTQASLTGGKGAGLPYEPGSFDLITCMNALHYFSDPVATLRGLSELLLPQGQLLIEDYARRTFPFPWPLFEWLIKRFDPQHRHAFTLEEAQELCQQAGLEVSTATHFSIDLLWKGWALLAWSRSVH